MPTISIDGSIYHADSLERREIAHLAPSTEVTHTINRIRTQINNGETHIIGLSDLPSATANICILSVSTGTVEVTLTDSSADTVSFLAPKMIFLWEANITGISISCSEDNSVYDLILGSKE